MDALDRRTQTVQRVLTTAVVVWHLSAAPPVQSARAAAQERPVAAAVVAPASVSAQERAGVLLDSVLRTPGVGPDVPLADRIGDVPDQRVRALIGRIDQSIGGGAEWPHVIVVPHLARDHDARGRYVHMHLGDGSGSAANPPTPIGRATHPPGAGPLAVQGSQLWAVRAVGTQGIKLDAGHVNRYFAGERRPGEASLRSVVVHEVQHATTHDNEAALRASSMAPEGGAREDIYRETW